MEWKIYYGDGTTTTSDDCSPEQVDKRNVQAIIEPDDEVGRIILTGSDYYWWEDGGWYNGDKFGLYDYLIRSGSKIVLFGRTIPTSEYREIHSTAVSDEDFPAKSARSPREGDR